MLPLSSVIILPPSLIVPGPSDWEVAGLLSEQWLIPSRMLQANKLKMHQCTFFLSTLISFND
jgi:hypothetical protein